AVTGAAVDRQHAFHLGMRSRDYVHTNELTYSARRGSACVSCGFHRADISAHKHCHVTRADVFLAEQLHVGRLDHCVSGFDGADQTFRLDHSEWFQGHLRQSSLFKIVEVKNKSDLRLKLPPRATRIKRRVAEKP